MDKHFTSTILYYKVKHVATVVRSSHWPVLLLDQFTIQLLKDLVFSLCKPYRQVIYNTLKLVAKSALIWDIWLS